MDKQIVVLTDNEIFFSQRNEVLVDATMWMNLKNIYAKLKKPDSKGHLVFCSIYMKHSE